MRSRTAVPYLIVGVLAASFGCKQSHPDGGPVATCSREAPDICWSDAKTAANRASDEAIAKFEIACNAEDFKHQALACTWAGLGLQGKRDERPRAISMHEKACDMGIQTSCAHLGALLMGQVWSGDPKRAEAQERFERIRTLITPVCESDPLAGEEKEFGTDPRAYACTTLAPHYEHGFATSKDLQKAFDIWSRACELGDSQGCAQKGFFYQRGLGVEKDLAAAVENYQAACDANSAMGCANLAWMYMHGTGVDRDYGRASALYERACERHYLDSCTKVGLSGVFAETEGDMSKRLDDLLAHLDEEAAEIDAKLGEGDPSDKEWVKQKLRTMFDVDQLYRRAFDYRQHFDDATAEEFQKALGARIGEVDAKHLTEFKEIIDEWGWITRSEFDSEASNQAWLIVQHADRDPAFQAKILERLETLREEGEIDPAHYAYLYDRVAVNQDREQRFGTQGRCVDGSWQPRPMEEPGKVDERRASVGLEPLAEYRKEFEGKCP